MLKKANEMFTKQKRIKNREKDLILILDFYN